MKSNRSRITRKQATKKKNVVVPAITRHIQKPVGMDQPLHVILHLVVRISSFLFIMLLGALVAITVICIVFFSLYLRVIAVHSGMDSRSLVRTMVESRYRSPVQTDGRKNILILGTDILGNRDSDSVRTDTIMLASVGVKKGDVKLISFPRDLWIASQSGKINALYEAIGYRQQATEKINAVIGEISGLTIHHTVVIDIETVGKIVNAFGGLDIPIERSFVDAQFPKSDVNVRVERDPRKLYETVAFTKGVEHMTGDRILQYIRSRHSSDPIEGSDDGRVRRQQVVIATLLSRLKDPRLAREPEVLGRLYAVYAEEFSNQLSVEELGALFWQMLRHHAVPVISSYQLPVQGVSENPVLFHPDKFSGGAWVYEPIDPTWGEVRKTIYNWISL